MYSLAGGLSPPTISGLVDAPVYPRVCGGTSPALPYASVIVGLSPRVRGNPAPRLSTSLGQRSIPACAGEPYVMASPSWSVAVYPRVCGGTSANNTDLRDALGLSPRVRGNRIDAVGVQAGRGSIPACAGEPRSILGGTPLVLMTALHSGLSPRVRGNRPAFVEPGPHAGSIPACAGEPPGPT